MKRKNLFVYLIIIALIVILSLSYFFQKEITNFEECAFAGNPIMESYPRQCIANGQTFIEEIEYFWKLDNIMLMQHETEGYFGCFGCNEGGEEPPSCLDPIMEMKSVEETPERYCNDRFEVIEE